MNNGFLARDGTFASCNDNDIGPMSILLCALEGYQCSGKRKNIRTLVMNGWCFLRNDVWLVWGEMTDEQSDFIVEWYCRRNLNVPKEFEKLMGYEETTISQNHLIHAIA